MPTSKVPEHIAAAARQRFADATARQQRERVEKANETGNLLSAETDTRRRLRRFRNLPEVSEDQARSLARGTAPAQLGLAGEAALGAERIQGKTTDFVGVSFLDRARAASRCVARVISRDGSPIGSGFLVSPHLFLTNNHVIPSVADAAEMLLEFNYELDLQARARPVTRFAIDARAFFLTNAEDDLDFTLVAVGPRDVGNDGLDGFGFCPILDADDKHLLGEFVNIVQHPEGDYKQVVLRENQLVSRLETVLHYLADTSPGSSGSPVFNDQWEAVALHHYGEPYRQTVGPDGRPVSRELNEGIRISAIVKALVAARSGLDNGPRRLLDEALAVLTREPSRAGDIAVLLSGPKPTDGTYEGSDETSEPGATPDDATAPDAGRAITLIVPLEITVRLGTGAPQGVVVTTGTTTPTAAAERKLAPDRNYANRKGYDPDFLPGVKVNLPVITPDAPGTPARLLNPARGDDPYVLKYEHFSIIMNADRKMAFVTAVNIDGA